jgi:hypothetical protein
MYYEDQKEAMSVADKIDAARRILLIVIGLAILALGLFLTLKMFFLIYSAAMAPESIKEQFVKWVAFLLEGAKKEDFELLKIPPNIVALAGFGLFSAILTWISLSIMATGARILSWTRNEQEEMKRLMKDLIKREQSPKDLSGKPLS